MSRSSSSIDLLNSRCVQLHVGLSCTLLLLITVSLPCLSPTTLSSPQTRLNLISTDPGISPGDGVDILAAHAAGVHVGRQQQPRQRAAFGPAICRGCAPASQRGFPAENGRRCAEYTAVRAFVTSILRNLTIAVHAKQSAAVCAVRNTAT
jgi:hypothetical protein